MGNNLKLLCHLLTNCHKTDLFIGALLVDYSPSTVTLTIWCINSEICIIYSKEDRVFFVDCWRNKNPIILSAFSENNIYNALLNVGNFMVVYSNIKFGQDVDQFLTMCDMTDVQSWYSVKRGFNLWMYGLAASFNVILTLFGGFNVLWYTSGRRFD